MTYNFTDQNIAWPGEAKKYVSTPIGNGYTSVEEIAPPPNWQLQYPNGYNSSNLPNLATDYRFQNWMRTAGLPTFSKLYGRNDTATMKAGRYRITVGLSEYFAQSTTPVTHTTLSDFPVKPYKGTKSIVISTVSWIGGKNSFLGWAYVAAAALFVFFAVAGTARHLIKPRCVSSVFFLPTTYPPPDAWEICLCFPGIGSNGSRCKCMYEMDTGSNIIDNPVSRLKIARKEYIQQCYDPR